MNKDVFYYAVCDSIADMFGPMFPAINVGVAKRMFRKLLSDVDNVKEYGLWQIGIFDQETGDFKTDSKFVCNGAEFLEVKE